MLVTYLENVSREVLVVLNSEADLLPQIRDRTTRLDLIITVTASVTVRGHDKNVLRDIGSASVRI